MDFFILAARAGLLVFPLSVGFLAGRRLFLSRSGNAWIYAGVGLLAVFTLVGLLPWAMLALPASPFIIGLAVALPAIWLAVVLICGPGQSDAYDIDALDPDADPAPPPLVLTNPVPAPPVVFRHTPRKAPLKSGSEPDASGSVLAAARGMRGNRDSEKRRPKALPPPLPVLPFLKS